MIKVLKNLKIELFNSLTFLDISICAFISICICTSSAYIREQIINMDLYFIINVLLYFFGLLFFDISLKYLINRLIKSKSFKLKIFEDDRFFVVKNGLIILICWLPILVMLYPGTAINDTWSQLQQAIDFYNGKLNLSAHHPVFDTFIMGIVILPIALTTSKWHISFFVYVIVQAICTSMSFAYTLKYAKTKLKLNNSFLLIFLIIYCILPIFSFSVQTISKDALFSWIYVLFIIEYIELIRTKGEYLKEKKNIIKLIFLTLLCLLSKKVSLYVIGISFVFLIIFLKGFRKQIISTITLVIIINFIISLLLQITLNVKKSGMQEMLSIPFQQTALYVITYPDEVTYNEKEIISRVLDYDNLKDKYNPTDADEVKGYEQISEDSAYIDYIKVWIKMFFKHPNVYFDAFNCMIAGWLSDAEYRPLNNMNHHSQLIDGLIPSYIWERRDNFKETTDMLNSIYDNVASIPIIGTVFTFGFYVLIIPLFIISYLIDEIIKRNNKVKFCLLTIIPMVLSICIGCFMAPVSAHIEGLRYLYPVTYTALLSIMWCIYVKKINLKEGKNNEI